MQVPGGSVGSPVGPKLHCSSNHTGLVSSEIIYGFMFKVDRDDVMAYIYIIVIEVES